MSKMKKASKEALLNPPDLEAADLLLDPSTQAARTINRYLEQEISPQAVPLIASLLGKRNQDDKNSSDTEAMLMAQAQSLDAIFHNLAQKAAGIPVADTTHIQAIDSLLRLGFKAQSQCKATLEALEGIKNPFNRAFIKQQNVAYQQQINNGLSSDSPSVSTDYQRSVDNSFVSKNPTNELLETQHEPKWLDTRTPIQTGLINPTLETVG